MQPIILEKKRDLQIFADKTELKLHSRQKYRANDLTLDLMIPFWQRRYPRVSTDAARDDSARLWSARLIVRSRIAAPSASCRVLCNSPLFIVHQRVAFDQSSSCRTSRFARLSYREYHQGAAKIDNGYAIDISRSFSSVGVVDASIFNDGKYDIYFYSLIFVYLMYAFM